MKEYTVKTAFVFEGFFFIKADNAEQARQAVEQHCGLVMGSSIHTTLPDDDVDWDFNTHPETVIKNVKLLTSN
jgi:hypothetical protein